jgi:hypothetical protein
MKYRIVAFIARLLGVRILIQQWPVSDLPIPVWQAFLDAGTFASFPGLIYPVQKWTD